MPLLPLLCSGCLVQRVMDAHLDTLLVDAPRRSVLLVDTEKSSEEG